MINQQPYKSKLLLLAFLFSVFGQMNLYAQSVPTGAINGVFSVSPTTYVWFSKGNLQYRAKSTARWQFATNQYDYIGSNNSSISSSYTGFIDLFGFGTSGYDHGPTCYQPYSTSTDNDDYEYRSLSVSGKSDWGWNTIYSGNTSTTGWRTMTSDEWDYLFNERSTTSGLRYVRATVNSTKGIVLLPDNWDTNYYTLNSGGFSANDITSSQWTTLEQYGAVFLPAAGRRSGTTVSNVNTEGWYWSSTVDEDHDDVSYYFYSSYLSRSFDHRHYGCSVRLVKDNTSVTLSINATSSPSGGGAVSGTGTFQPGATCTLTAIPSSGYYFINWTENGVAVSTLSTYTFEVTSNRNLVANFSNIVPTGAINGQFSVSATQRVFFSQGNLQYQASSNTWRFALNQWNFVGGTYNGSTCGNVSGSSNNNVSSSYSGWIDYFGWGTSGYNHGAVCYQPWSTSSTISDYYAYGNSSSSLNDQTGMADWGYNKISNGGNITNRWRTLTKDECDYLFNTRTTSSGVRYAKAVVNNVNGVILLPDDWSTSYYSLNNTNSASANYYVNTISSTNWVTLQQHGAVFLPAAGFRLGTSVQVDAIPNWASYHLATKYSIGESYRLRFTGTELEPMNHSAKYYGYSVRLVRNVDIISSATISVSASPSAGGTINGAGVYEQGAICILNATPASGYTFSKWTKNGTQVSTNANYSFTVNGDESYVAVFTANTYDISVSASPTAGGTVSGSGTYSHGSSCTLTATAATGYDFTKWTKNGAQVSTNANYTFTVTSGGTYVAVFTKRTYNISASSNPTAGGTVTGAGTYEYGSSCTLKATAATGYNFTKWTKNGSQVSTNANYTFTVTASGTYVAQFTKKTYTVSATASPTTGGTVSGGGTFEHGASVTLTATPATGYTFTNWKKGNTVVSTNATYTFTATEAATYTATFTLNSYAITATSNPTAGGTITGAGTYNHGVNVTLTATANAGYTFVNWTLGNNVVSTDSEYSFQVSGGGDYVANFSLNSYSITVTADPTAGGTVTGAGTYDHGTNVTLTATAATGYTFVNWTENGTQVSTNASYQFTVSGARTLIANFNPNTYTVTLNANEGTINSGNVTSYTYGVGATLPTDVTRTGYTFDGWFDNSGLTGSAVTTISATATGDKTFWAKWTVNSYTLTINYQYINGTTAAATHTESVNYNASYSVASPDITGYTPDLATVNGTMGAQNLTVTVTYTINSYEITATADPTTGGTITGAGTYDHGETVTLTATVNEGYVFEGWSKDGETVLTEPSISFTVTEAADYVAHFTLLSYPVEITAFPTEGGTVTGAGTYYHGDLCTLTAVPNEGYFFVNWTQDGVAVSTNTEYSFTVNGPATYVANFISIYFNVTAIATPEGSGTVTGAGSFYYGETCTLTAVPNSGFFFVSWTQDGAVVSTDATYSFAVTGARTLQANFSLPTQTYTLPAGWSWWSTNVEISLSDLETALGTSGASIVSQNGSVEYLPGFGWDGAFTELDLSQMYEINVTENVELTVSGLPANPEDHPVTIRNNWNWIGYPVQQSMSVKDALTNLAATSSDKIKSKSNGFATRVGSTWTGSLKTLEPGEGYLYYSKATGTKTFTYPSGSKGGIVEPNVTDENNFWKANPERFANNMNMMAVVEIDGIESASDDVEIGAFVDGECRGSVRLMYVEEIGRHMAFLTIHGETGEPVSFKVKDADGIRDLDERIAFQVNGMIGEVETPYVLHASSEELSLFPNPANRNERVHVTLPASIKSADAMVEVYNALGVLVGSFQLNGNGELEGFHVSGLYTVKVTDRKGNVRFAKLVVK